MLKGDKIIIDFDGSKFALDTSVIAGIIEVEKIPFLPGQKGFVNGIISLRGEPVTVIDLKKAFKAGLSEKGPSKIIVVRDKGRLIGFDIGLSEVSFIWDEELKEKELSKGSGDYIAASFNAEDPIQLIDWTAL